ncbi:MAG: SulP family inorganic anion transporter, partial [Flavobacteriales bacterium]|nr:SulP family inorganic anion transporter [Flavobacteriales bacterium]
TLAIDGLDPQKRKSNLDKDVAAVGFGSSLAGLVGGLPMISEIVRSSANISSGARTQWSNFFHAVFLLMFIVVLRPVIEHIPLSALAAMLIYTGYRLASPHEFKHALSLGRSELLVFCTTLVMVLFTDLIIGIASGIVLNMLILVFKGVDIRRLFTYRGLEVEGESVVIKPDGALCFTNYLGLKKVLEKNKNRDIVLDLQQVNLIDHTVLSHLYSFEKRQHEMGLSVTHTHDGHLHSVGTNELSEQRENPSPLGVLALRRNVRMAELAEKLHGKYEGRAKNVTCFEAVNLFQEREVSEVRNCIHFEVGKLEATMADISLRSASRFAHHDSLITVLHLRLENVPEFRLLREMMLDKMLESVGRQDIDFSNYPEFSNHYLLQGTQENDVRIFFTPKMVEYLEMYKGYNLYGNSAGLVITRNNALISVGEMLQMLQFSEGLVLRMLQTP